MTLFNKRAYKLPMFERKLLLSMLIVSLLLGSTHQVLAGGKADPILTKMLIDEFEVRDVDKSNPWLFDGQGWVGKDLQKLWFKAEVERAGSETLGLELQALYSQAMATFWDVQVGLRQDFKPSPSRSWAVIGFQGLAPYFFEIDTALFIGESGRTALRLVAEYELLFTQRLILTPDIEVNVHGQNDSDLGIGSGLSDIEVGLRLRYEIRREFAPYIGVNWNKSFGNTANFSRKKGEEVDELQWLVGIRAWF